MKLDLEKIKEITSGAVNIREENDVITFHRLTDEQENYYLNKNTGMYKKGLASAGVKFRFETDSKKLFIKIFTSQKSTRGYFAMDVEVDGKLIGSIENYNKNEIPVAYASMDYPFGSFSKEFDLGEGVKTVVVYFPFSIKTDIEEISVDDGAYVKGIKYDKKLLVWGDSITQGYDALNPSSIYIGKIADKLGMEEINKAIGGEKFAPELAKLKDDINPDCIYVAYGTNDWVPSTKEEFEKNCKGFFENLSKSYPSVKIYAVTPVWRKDMDEDKGFTEFKNIEKCIRDLVEGIENITVIPGLDLVPHDEKYYADLRLHPNDEGFKYFYDNLCNLIKL